jgi:hypothetical protein
LRLLAITVELHAFRDELNWDEPLRLGVNISGRPFIRMWQQRGDSVGFDGHALEPEDFGEAGRVEVHDITERLDPSLRNAPIREVRMIEGDGAEPIGLALLRPNRDAFCVWINDDCLRWGDATAPAAESKGRKAVIGALLPQT